MITQFTVRHFETIGSTSDEARRLAHEGAPHGIVIHADEQTAGRGRLSHTWFSPPGNLYLSILLRTGAPPARSAELGFLTALAVADTVGRLLPRNAAGATLKWPNDVLIGGSKIAGILLEQACDALILGIGLNILLSPANTAYKTTTVIKNGGIASVDVARDILLERIDHYLDEWSTEGFAPIRREWVARSYPIGTSMQTHLAGQMIAGQFAGIDHDGTLLLDTPEGRRRVAAGEIVVRPAS